MLRCGILCDIRVAVCSPQTDLAFLLGSGGQGVYQWFGKMTQMPASHEESDKDV